MSAQHVQSPGFNSPALLKKLKNGKEDKWHFNHLIVEKRSLT
jgi:hypothetical protein